jgi:hypothetical protein
MASYPPPYPPPPYGVDPRQQRRMLKDQVRAQRDAYKAQRNFYKQQQRGALMQARAMRRGSILGPLIVVALGVVLLLIRLGNIPFASFAAWYGRWWPLLFVAAGLVLVAEWAFDQTTQSGQPQYVRRGAGGGVFFLLLVLAVTGAIVSGWERHDIWRNLSINPDNFAEFIGDKHEREQTIDQTFPVGTSLSVRNEHGGITVNGKSDDGKIHIVAYKEIYSQSDSDADKKADELVPSVQLADGHLSVDVPARPGATVDLTVTVPEAAAVMVETSRGEVHVSGLKAPVSVTANHGDVEVSNVTGSVTAHFNHRDSSFSAHSVTGDVTLKGDADDLNLTGITGAVTLDGDFYGDTHLEKITGTTTFRTSRTNLTFAKLNGTVDISPEAELTGTQIVGPTVLSTRSRNIALQEMSGDVNVSDTNGTVDVSSLLPLGDVTVNNRSGSVTVSVPEGAGFNVDAQTTGGEISNDFGFSVLEAKNRNSVSAKVGTGASRISISTSHGDVAVRKGSAMVPEVSPAPAAPPEAPAKPGKTGKGTKSKQLGSSVTFE